MLVAALGISHANDGVHPVFLFLLFFGNMVSPDGGSLLPETRGALPPHIKSLILLLCQLLIYMFVVCALRCEAVIANEHRSVYVKR
jgi:hypothetical protein